MNSNEILNKYINLIDKGYCSDCNELNCIDNFPHSKITHAIRELQQENKKLKEKVKKLSQWDINKDTRNSRQRVANAKLLKENEELREKLDKYENPEDMTLMMMWCTEQVKDENKKLKEKYENAVADYETTMAEKNKLKKKLEVPETCNLKTLEDYKNYYEDTTREQILEDTYIEYCAYVNLAHRYSELKKQLENKYKKVGTLTSELLYEENTKLINQQKEFVNYLEDEIQKKRGKATTLTSFTRNVVQLKHCLQKYKSIIGDDK